MPLQIATSTETAPNLIISSPTPLATAPPDVPHAFSNAPPHVDADSLSPPTNSSEFPPKTTTSPAGTHPTRLETARKRLRPYYAWAAPHLTRKGLAPVVRSSVALFVGLILLLVQRTQLALGPGAFIVLIVGGIAPPSLPVTSVVEQVVVQSIVVLSTWAWCSLGIFFAHLARRKQYTQEEFVAMVSAPLEGLTPAQISFAVEEEIITGKHLEPGSSAVLLVFLGIAMGALLFVRGRLGHGPGLISIFLAIILVSIALTSAPLFPYPYYALSEIFVIPFFAQSAISLVCSFVILPETVAASFLDRLVDTLLPIQRIVAQQHSLFKSVEGLAALKASVLLAEARFGSLQELEVNLTREFTYARIGGKDLSRILDSLRSVVATSAGFIAFFSTVDTRTYRVDEATKLDGVDALFLHLGRRPQSPTPGSATPRSRPGSSPHSRHASFDEDRGNIIDSPPRLSRRKSFDVEGASNRLERHTVGSASPYDSKRRSKSKPRSHRGDFKPVGLNEISRYMHLEKILQNPLDHENLETLLPLLASSSSQLLGVSEAVIGHLVRLFTRLSSTTIHALRKKGRSGECNEETMAESTRLVEELRAALDSFKMDKRLIVIEPFRTLFDYTLPPANLSPSHSAMYWAFSYQFSLLSFASTLLRLLEITFEIEKKRKRFKLFTPVWRKMRFREEHSEEHDEQDDIVDEATNSRNPDFDSKPSRLSSVQVIAIQFHRIAQFLSSSSFLFACKGGAIVALLSVTAVATPASASFFYRNRGIWTIIICALTVTQYSGDTFLGFINRIIGTFVGSLAGLLVWSIATAGQGGSATANPYALAGVCVFAFPLAMFARLYSPAATQVNIIAIATFALVVGYSWQNTTSPSLSSIGSGFEVAWRRMLGVAIGVVAAAIGSSVIPPIVTRKTTVRKSYGRNLSLLGTELCQVLSYANTHDGPTAPSRALVKSLDSLRRRITRTGVARSTVAYEISLRGPWPSKSYEKIHRLELEILDLISQLHNVLCLLPPLWKRALLKRTQFSSRPFLGPFLSAFQLASTGLAEKKPIPFLCGALLENYLQPTSFGRRGEDGQRGYGYEVTLDDDDEQGLPAPVDVEVISSLTYFQFAIGVSIMYGCVSRIDQILLVVKELCGESYIVKGGKEEEEVGLLFAHDNNSFGTATPMH